MKRIVLFMIVLVLSKTSFSQQAEAGNNSGKNTDSVRSTIPLEENDDDRVFSKVETEAMFPGSRSAWVDYLRKNLDASTPVLFGAKAGTYMVIIRFVVSKDGTISHVVAETKYGYGMEKEAIRVIKNGPKWIPAYQNGRAVNAYRRQPITFVVQEDNGPDKR